MRRRSCNYGAVRVKYGRPSSERENTRRDNLRARCRVSRSSNLENGTKYEHQLFHEEGDDIQMAKNRLRVCIGYNDDGSPVIKQLRGDNELELVDKAVKAILASERRGEFLDGVVPLPQAAHSAVTFGTYAEQYFVTYKVPSIKLTTQSYYRGMLRHFYSVWDNVPIDSITTEDVQTFLNDRRDMSAKSLHEMRMFLKAIFTAAVSDDLIAKNPVEDKRLRIPSTKKKVRKALEAEEVRDILSNLNKLEDVERRFIALLLYTGMRRGEVLGLRWEDIDVAKNVIHVERNVTFPGGHNDPVIGTPKTEAGKRNVPIAPGLLSQLEPMKEHGFIIGDGERPITASINNRMYQRITRKIDLHGATPHNFRHTVATMLNDAGASIKTIQAVIGDADFQTVANRYVHSREGQAQQAINDFSQLLA